MYKNYIFIHSIVFSALVFKPLVCGQIKGFWLQVFHLEKAKTPLSTAGVN